MRQLLLIVLFGLLSDSSWAENSDENIPPLQVTHTWGELLAQKPVVLRPPSALAKAPYQGKSLTIRLGIDQTRAKKYGYVVLYCIAQGDLMLTDLLGPNDEQSLGPCRVNVQTPLKELSAQSLETMTTDRYMLTHPYALYMKALPLSEEGDYTITIQRPNEGAPGPAITSVKVVVSPVQEKTWSPWSIPENRNQPTCDGGRCQVNVINPSGGWGIPEWDGEEPIFLDKLPEAKIALPSLIANKPDDGFQLSLSGNELVVKLGENEGLTEMFPEQKFLTRWWVNDKLVALKHELVSQQAFAWSGAESPVTEIHFLVEFHPEFLGAKKGDKIGVQLLYCPEGQKYMYRKMMQVQVQQTLTEMTAANFVPRSIASPTNRIDFIYSGDPKNIQAK